MPTIDMAIIASQHSIYANGFLYIDGDITIDSAYFTGTGDIVIVANGNITYNVDTLTSNNEEDEQTGRILLYSEEGNITINGTQIEINIYKYEEPIISIDIDLEELFDGNSNLFFGFISADPSNSANVMLDGFAIAQEPFTTLQPDELPEEEQDRYQILSMGDGDYGYEVPFDADDWNGSRGRITSDQILIASGMYDSNAFYCTVSREVSEDYSFSGRFTASISGSDPCHYMNFILSSSPEDRAHSVCIHLDTYQSGSAHWRNEFGEYIEGQPDGWYEGVEPFESMVSVCINGDERHDYLLYSTFLSIIIYY